jgi:ABC-type uncharacterized transport system permease subunit
MTSSGGLTTATLAETTLPEAPTGRHTSMLLGGRYSMLVAAAAFFVIVSAIRAATDTASLTSSQTIGTAIRSTVPILLAGLAGLWAERVGIVNIGIEGMMILGTWFGGWAAWQWGGWVGLVAAIIGGALGGLVHGVATVRFNVDHVISGVAINILAFGATRYLSELAFVGEQGGGISQSPPQSSGIPTITVPFLAGGGDTADALGTLEDKGWFLISDIAGVLRGFMVNLSWATVLAGLLVPVTWWVLWRTRFGLRVRSSGEAPAAAETLGVRVIPLRYSALAISGGFAGLGGGFLAIVSSSYYRQGQTADRGFIGLATTIFGNWRPVGVLGGAALFGYGEALNLVGRTALPKLFLLVAIVAGLLAVRAGIRRHIAAAVVAGILAVLCLVGFLTVDEVPESLTKSVPYVLTLVVLATAARRLRPPAWAGRPYHSGEEH